jgi:molybdate/tungstate transport system permease protein
VKRLSSLDIIAHISGGLVLIFIVAPLLGMALNCPIFPDGGSYSSSLVETVRDPEVQRSIWLTLGASLGGTLALSVAAVPFSFLLARRSFPLKRLVLGIIDLPVVIPHSAAGIALLGVLNRDSLVGRLGASLGLSFVGNPTGIAVAMAFVSLPFLINAAREAFAMVPERLEKAALNLGASPLRVFLTISLPLAWRGILSGMVLMFARGLSEFGAVIVIAYHPMITPVLIYERFTAFGLKYARAVAVLFILVCLVVFIALRLLAGGGKDAENQ